MCFDKLMGLLLLIIPPTVCVLLYLYICKVPNKRKHK